MNKLLLFLLFGLLAITASATGVDLYTQNVLVDLHNIERSCLGLGNLTWDATIAATAQDWADYLAANNLFKHSGDYGVGENIAEASIRDNMAAFLFSLWAAEKKHFSNANPYPDVTIDGEVDGHYTQIIWGSTDSVGCGIANMTSMSYLVCQYKPPGNYKGQYVYTSSDIVKTPNCNPGASQATTPATSTTSTTSSTSATGKTTTTTKVTTTIKTPTHSTTTTNTTASSTQPNSINCTSSTVVTTSGTQNSTNTTTSSCSNASSPSTNSTTPTNTTINVTQSPSPSKPRRPNKPRGGKGRKQKKRVFTIVVDMTNEFDDVEIVIKI